jgi:hypothetical protein
MELRVVQALVSHVKTNSLNPHNIILNGALPMPLLVIFYAPYMLMGSHY